MKHKILHFYYYYYYSHVGTLLTPVWHVLQLADGGAPQIWWGCTNIEQGPTDQQQTQFPGVKILGHPPFKCHKYGGTITG
jgi:hypothetical protein